MTERTRGSAGAGALPPPAPPPVLEVRDISVSYGGVRALVDVSVSVPERSVVGVIGPNGAGKTTFIDAVTGFAPSTGTVLFDGRPIHNWPAHRRARAGLARTFQGVELFQDLTVRENVLTHSDPFEPAAWLRDMLLGDRSTSHAGFTWVAQVLGLADLADLSSAALPAGTRRLVGMARALAGRPRLLLLDEPGAGLDRQSSGRLARTLRDFVDDRVTTVLLVDHDMGLVFDVCDFIYVLDFGRLIVQGTPDEVRANPAVIRAYLGAGFGH